MSEYWVSHKKYFCKYCNIYIADDAPSRQHHEGGMRHKGNVERFVRGLYKAGEKRKYDLEDEKREMVRVEQAAQAAFAKDVSAGLVKPGSSSAIAGPSNTAVAPKPLQKPTSVYANYSSAASLGYTDPDEERYKAEAERRRTQGVAGEWEVVGIVEPEASHSVEEKPNTQPTEPNASRKREAEAEPPVDDDDTRRFKLRKKTLGAGLGEIYDPGVIPIKLKAKKEEEGLTLDDTTGQATGSEGSSATALPKWSARGWDKPGEAVLRENTHDQPDVVSTTESEANDVWHADNNVDVPVATSSVTESTVVKIEESNIKDEGDKTQPTVTPTAPATGGLFRKRRLPAGGAGRRL